jgi:hypothetical protein
MEIIMDVVVNHTAHVIQPKDGVREYEYKFSKPLYGNISGLDDLFTEQLRERGFRPGSMNNFGATISTTCSTSEFRFKSEPASLIHPGGRGGRVYAVVFQRIP